MMKRLRPKHYYNAGSYANEEQVDAEVRRLNLIKHDVDYVIIKVGNSWIVNLLQ